MAKNQNTFAKRRREMEKKFKAEEKRARRTERKQAAETNDEPESTKLESLEQDVETTSDV